MQENNTILLKKTLREQVADTLRRQILSGKYKPGERIIETEISKTFDISRGPVREALRQLEEEGLVTYQTNKGCEVKTISYRDMQESYLIRCTLETLAVKIYSGELSSTMRAYMQKLTDEIGMAAQEEDLYRIIEADEAFHSCIIEEAGCDQLYRMWKSLEAANTASYFTMDTEELMPFKYLRVNHQYILDAFGSKSVDEICSIIEEHYMIVPKELYKKKEQQ